VVVAPADIAYVVTFFGIQSGGYGQLN